MVLDVISLGASDASICFLVSNSKLLDLVSSSFLSSTFISSALIFFTFSAPVMVFLLSQLCPSSVLSLASSGELSSPAIIFSIVYTNICKLRYEVNILLKR